MINSCVLLIVMMVDGSRHSFNIDVVECRQTTLFLKQKEKKLLICWIFGSNLLMWN